MALPLPNFDDKTYAELVEEAISQIPLEYPEWTDHNPTDTGIILIELLAWLTEMVLYRVNQIPDENYASYISLLKGEQWNLPINASSQERQNSLRSQIHNTLGELRKTYRAITSEDFEKLILDDWNQSQTADTLKILRVNCLAQRNLELNAEVYAKGHISLVVVPKVDSEVTSVKNKYQSLLNFLDERRLLTTRLHIVEPDYVSLSLEVELVLKDGANPENVKKQAQQEAELFFDSRESGKYWQGQGWYFGRNVYISELYKLFDDLEGVDYVKTLQIKDKENKYQSEINLADYQLVKINLANSTFKILVEVGDERKEI